MKIDLSRSLRHLLNGAIDRARGHGRRGAGAAEASAWEEAARIAEQLAEQAQAPADRDRWQTTASDFRQAAARLQTAPQRGPAPLSTSAASAASGSSASRRSTVVAESPETSEHAETIRRLIHKSTVRWDDIAGMDDTKAAIQTAYAMSVARAPSGVELRPVRNILLYGPPGVGKSLLAAACSTTLDATFFNVKISHLLSKYFGESSKLVSALYDEARRLAPSVIFFDEIDALTGSRDGHDAAAERRLLANLLAELDGVAEKDGRQFVMTVAATNTPWSIDSAVLSRFERKVLIPLPDDAARRRILELHLTDRGYQVEPGLDSLVLDTAGYSGRELERLAKLLVERMLAEMNPELAAVAARGRDALAGYQIQVAPIRREQIRSVLAALRPETTLEQLRRYDQFARG